MKKITFLIASVCMITAAIAQFPQGNLSNSSRNPVVQSNNPDAFGGYVPAPVAVLFTDDMDDLNDTTSLQGRGYFTYYRGTGPQGAAPYWFQGNPTVFTDFNGIQQDGYVGSNFNTVTGTNNIDNWLVLPDLNIQTGDTLSFYSRSPAGSTYPDSIVVMFNPTGATVPEDANWTELGRFKVNVAGMWERKWFLASSDGANARFAIRYKVANSGPTGTAGDYIGIDQIDVIEGAGGSTPCPVPHDCCSDAADINSAFAGAVGTKVTVGPYDNSLATTDIDDPATGFECFGEPDGGGAAPTLDNTLWYSFTGTGDLYFIETDNCGTPPVANYIDDGDTQIALYTGSCGNLTPVLCNEDGPQATSTHYPAGFNLQTQAGVNYVMIVDGFNYNGTLSTGNFCISVTKLQGVACGAPNISAGTGAVNKNCVNYGDTLIGTIAGAVAPTQGPYSGFGWVISTSSISGNNDPLNDPSVVGGGPIMSLPSGVSLINNGTPFAAGIYYFTPVVFGNAQPNPNVPGQPQYIFQLILDPNCTTTGTSIMVELKAQSQPCGLGVNEIGSQPAGFTVYPVPVKDIAYFTLNLSTSSTAEIQIKDNLGRVVISESKQMISGENHLNLDLSSIPSGVYFMAVQTADKNYVSKFIKE